MLVTFFKDFGYYKMGKTYNLNKAAAEYLLKTSFSCFNGDPFDVTEGEIIGAVDKIDRPLLTVR